MFLKEIRSLGWPENFRKHLAEKDQDIFKDLEIPEDFVGIAEKTMIPRTLEMVHDRYKNCMSFGEIGDKYGLTGEYVRQLVNNAETRVRWVFYRMRLAKTKVVYHAIKPDEEHLDIRDMSPGEYFKDRRDPHTLVLAGNSLARTKVVYHSIKPEHPGGIWRCEEIHVETIRDVIDLIRSGNIKLVRNFGKKCLEAVINQLLADGVTREELGLEESE